MWWKITKETHHKKRARKVILKNRNKTNHESTTDVFRYDELKWICWWFFRYFRYFKDQVFVVKIRVTLDTLLNPHTHH